MPIMTFLSPESLLVFTLCLPLLAALTSSLITSPTLRDGTTIFIGIFTFLCVLTLLHYQQSDLLVEVTLLHLTPALSLSFKPESLSMIFALVASFLWPVTTLYAIGYMRGNQEEHQNRFFCFFGISIFGALGIAFASNLFSLFIFYELLTLATFPLVTHHGTKEAKLSGRTYLGVLITTSILFQLTAIILTYAAAGTLDFVQGGILKGHVSPAMAGMLLLLFIFGVGKAAVMPFHRWLPAAMVAPTPVSALLHAVAVVKAGIFTIIKVVTMIFGLDFLQEITAISWWHAGWMPWLASITILFASIIALMQDNLKLRLAYSTISQLSYAIFAAGLFMPVAITAAGFHIAAHAAAKITLFFAAGAIYTAAGKKYIHQLAGIGYRMPFTMACFSIGALSMIGLPPAAGFITKFYLMQGAHEVSEFFTIELILSTVLNAAYFLPIIFMAYFKPEDKRMLIKGHKRHREAPLTIRIALCITAGATIALFMFPDYFLMLAQQAGQPGLESAAQHLRGSYAN